MYSRIGLPTPASLYRPRHRMLPLRTPRKCHSEDSAQRANSSDRMRKSRRAARLGPRSVTRARRRVHAPRYEIDDVARTRGQRGVPGVELDDGPRIHPLRHAADTCRPGSPKTRPYVGVGCQAIATRCGPPELTGAAPGLISSRTRERVCRCSSMVELLLPKQTARVRFPSSAQSRKPPGHPGAFVVSAVPVATLPMSRRATRASATCVARPPSRPPPSVWS